MLRIVGYSDYICPYCYLGGVIVEQVLRDYEATLEWRGFEIHPEVPEEGVPIEALNPRVLTGIKASVGIISGRHGIEMQMPSRLPNSHRALLGAEFAREHDKHRDYHEAVFHAYFVEDRDIGRVDVLQTIAEGVGLDAEAFGRAVHDRTADPVLSRTTEECLRQGVTGVPTWIIEGRFTLSGALPPDHLRRSLDWAIERLEQREPRQ